MGTFRERKSIISVHSAGPTCPQPWLLLTYLGLTLGLTWPLALYFTWAIPGDSFDGWQNYWNLWWIRRALIDLGTNPYFTTYLDYPSGVSLLFHTLNIFNGLWTLPVQLLFGLIVAYNTVVLFSFAVGGLGGYLLAREALPTRSAWPAWIAGLIFTFSPYHFAHLLGHMQLFSLEWIPFYALYLLRATRRAKWRDAAMAGLFAFLVGLCDWYYVVYCGLFTVLYTFYLLVARKLTFRMVRILATIGLTGGALLAPLWVPMAREAARSTYMVPDPSQAIQLSADLLAFLTPNEMHPLWGKMARAWSESFTTTTSERMVFAGYVPLALAIYALARARSGTRFFWGLSMAIFGLLALGPVLHVAGQPVAGFALPYAWLSATLPFVKIMRSVSRFDVMVMLCLGVLAAWGVAHLPPFARHQPARHIFGFLLSGAVILEFLTVPYPLSPPDTPEFYRALATDHADYAILNVPMNWDRPNCLLYQTVHGKRLTSAYTSRNNPLSPVDRTPLLQDLRRPGPHVVQGTPEEVGLSVLHAFGVRYVVVDLYQMPEEAEREASLDPVRRTFGDRPPVFQDGRLIVWEVRPEDGSRPFVRLGMGWGVETVDVSGAASRALEGLGEIVLHAPQAGKFVLYFDLHHAGPASVKVVLQLAERTVWKATLAPGETCEAVVSVSANPGDTNLHLAGSGPGLELRAVGLRLMGGD